MKASIVFFVLAVLPFVCIADDKPGLSSHDFFTYPHISNVRISPDGTHIAALFNKDDKQLLFVRDYSNPESQPAVISVYNHNLRRLVWANDNRIIVAADIEKGRNRDRFVYVILDKDGSNMRYLTKSDKGARIISTLPNDPEFVLAEIWSDRHRDFPAVYKLGIGKRKLKSLVQTSVHNVDHWMSDVNGNIRLGVGYRADEKLIFARPNGKKWKIIKRRHYTNDPVFYPFVVYGDNKAYVASSHEGDKVSLYRYDLTKNHFEKRILRHEMVDITDIDFDPYEEKLLSVNYVVNIPEHTVLDPDFKSVQMQIDAAIPGRVNRVTSRSRDNQKLIVWSSSDVESGEYYFLDKKQNRLEFIGARYPQLAGRPLAKTQGIFYPAKDGMKIYGFISMPAGATSKNLPLVVLVHGGPHARVMSKYDARVQFLTSRGYLVFQPNFRGSTGYGNAYTVSGYKQWGQKMQTDVDDGVEQLIDNGLVDPKRICIMGSSYGGYSALMGVALRPDLYQCAISFAGVTDLNTLYISKGYSPVNRALIGGDAKLRKRYSPINMADAIQKPVLLAHGSSDRVVSINHSKRMASALKSRKRDVTFMRFKKEKHGFDKVKNAVKFYDAVEAFLNRNIGELEEIMGEVSEEI